jgi:hypothetical protein
VADTEARREAAEIVRHFLSGRLSNFEFEDKMPSTDDQAVRAIEDSLWYVYDDFTEHKLAGEWALPKETRARMARWIVFLHSDEEYLWPRISCPGLRPLEHGVFSRLFNGPRREELFMQVGNYDLWPFINEESFDRANRNPVLLAGS